MTAFDAHLADFKIRQTKECLISVPAILQFILADRTYVTDLMGKIRTKRIDA